MTGRLFVILLVSLFFSDLAYSIAKLDQKKRKVPMKWARQGLEKSVESEIEEVADPHMNSSLDNDFVSDDVIDAPKSLEYSDKNQPVATAEAYSERTNQEGQLGYLDADAEADGNSDLDYSEDEKILQRRGDTRSLQAGDTFTAQEMLPIARKLMNKLGESRGTGKGVISTSIDPKFLADNLFERFFVSMKRIVVLKDIDIPGLDALQALALSGEVIGIRSAASSVTESPANKRGETLIEENPIPKCHYKLLKKKINTYNTKGRITASKRRRVDISKKLAKNRKLVVNPAQRRPILKQRNRKSAQINLNKRKRAQSLKELNQITNNQGGSTAKDVCRWRYECTDPTRLESCGLHTDCSKDSALYMGLQLHKDELSETFKQFRRMVGVNVLDEEVEKILEKRYLQLRPQKLESGEKIESVADYFNKIVIREQLDALYRSQSPMATPRAQDSDENSSIIIPHQYSTPEVTDSDGNDDTTPESPQDYEKDVEELPVENVELVTKDTLTKELSKEEREIIEKDEELPADVEQNEPDQPSENEEEFTPEPAPDEPDQLSENEEEFTPEPAPE